MTHTHLASKGRTVDTALPSALPELLSPAGSPDALEAAFLAGADAVYLGGSHFNARINAHNFDDTALREAISYAHRLGGRVYLTLNTQIYDKEVKDALTAAYHAATAGVDGLILADMGIAGIIHETLPHLPIHASTQLSGHNRYAGHVLSGLGFSRFVLAREATLEDMKIAVKESGLEVEVFIHGALCVSHSGQCLFSSLVGGRSGNRGLCAQPCRLPYRTKKGKGAQYPLSLKDAALACHIPALIDAGVASLKIEGRMKSPAYVGGVTAIYRRLLDERRGATPEEVTLLAQLFSRDGFTDGYLTSTISGKMLGVRTEADKADSTQAAKQAAPKGQAFLPAVAEVTVAQDTPLTLTLSAPLFRQGEEDNQIISCTVTGDAPEVAQSTPTGKDTLQKQLFRLGGTAYVGKDLVCHIDEGLMVPMSKLNALRREGVAALDEARASALQALVTHRAAYLPTTLKSTPSATHRHVSHTAEFVSPSQIPPKAHEFFDILYLPLHTWIPREGKAYGVILPPVMFDSEVAQVKDKLTLVLSQGATHISVGNIGHLAFLKEVLTTLPDISSSDIMLHGNFRLNICNTHAAKAYLELGLDDLTLSPELTLPRIRDISAAYPMASGAVVYGRIPLMLLEKCVIRALYPDGGDHAPCGKAGEACAICHKGKAEMTDRMGISFPVLRTYPHRNIIYNSRPLSMTDRQDMLDAVGLCTRHYIFSIESSEQVEAVINATQKGQAISGEVSRMSK